MVNLLFTIFTLIFSVLMFLVLFFYSYLSNRIQNYFERRDDIEPLEEVIEGHARPIRHLSQHEVTYLYDMNHKQRFKQFVGVICFFLGIVISYNTAFPINPTTSEIFSILSTGSNQLSIGLFIVSFGFIIPGTGKIYLDLRSPVFGIHGMLNKWQRGKKTSPTDYLSIRNQVFEISQDDVKKRFESLTENRITYIEYSPWTKTIWKIEQF